MIFGVNIGKIQKVMNLYKHRKNKRLYTITHCIDEENPGIYASPWNHIGPVLTLISNNPQECIAFVLDNFKLVAHRGPTPDKIFKYPTRNQIMLGRE